MLKPHVNKILVPVTMNNEGLNAIKQAMYVHKKFEAQITFLHVIPRRSWFFQRFHKKAQRQQKKQVYAEFQDFVTGFFKKDNAIPEYVSLKVKRGTIIKVIISNISRLKYDLVIINKNLEQNPRNRASWEEGIRLVVGEAFCPVLTFNGGENFIKTISDIVVPVDIVRPHKQNVAWAIELARRFQAKVHIVSVLSVNIEKEKSRIYLKIKVIEKWLQKNGIECDVRLLIEYNKKIHEAILDFINHELPDLVVIMTHQEAIWNSNHIGKMADAIIEGSDRPVFSITPRKETVFTMLPKAFGMK